MMIKVAKMPSWRWTKVLSVRRHVSKAQQSIDHRVRWAEGTYIIYSAIKERNAGRDNRRHTFLDVMVACARNAKLESMKVVARYDAKVLRKEECCNCEMK
jgi:hypothetical protein